MTDSDFQRIEQALGCRLSDAFRQFMRAPPPDLGETSELTCRPSQLVALNRSGATAGWPTNQLALGDNGCGDVYSIDLDDPRGAVYLSGPHSGFESPDEEGYFEPVFATLEELAAHLIRIREGT